MVTFFKYQKLRKRVGIKVFAASEDPSPSNTNINTTQIPNVLKKMANGRELTLEETKLIRDLNLSQLALLSINNQTAEEFSRLDFEPGTVIKISLFFKDTNSVVSASSILTTEEVNQRKNTLDLSFLNYYSFSVDLFFIIATNNNTISWQSLIEFFYNKFFLECISWLYPNSIILESISFSRIFPVVDRNQARSMAFGTPGRLSSRTNPASKKPYVFTLISNFIFSQRNAFTIRLPKMSGNTNNYSSRNSGVPTDFIYKTASFLEKPIYISSSEAFTLKLAVKTLKEDSPIKYFPADRVLPLGFLSPVIKTPSLDSSFNSTKGFVYNSENAPYIQGARENSTTDQEDREGLTPEELNLIEQDFIEAESTDIPEEEKKKRGRPEGRKDSKPRSRRSSPLDTIGDAAARIRNNLGGSSDNSPTRDEPTQGNSEGERQDSENPPQA